MKPPSSSTTTTGREDEDDTSSMGFSYQQDPQLEDFIDSGCVNILFGVFLLLYIVALVIFYAAPGIDFHSDSFLYALLIWSYFKTLIPVVGILFVIFNVTNMPLTFVLLLIEVAGFLNSVALLVVFIDSAITCNSASRPDNICNDPLWGCVYLVPCLPGFPSVPSDLKPFDSFITDFILIGILALFEILLLSFTVALRQYKVSAEREFRKAYPQETMANNSNNNQQRPSPPENDSHPLGRQHLGGFFFLRPVVAGIMKIDRMLRAGYKEMGKLRSHNGVTANGGLYRPYPGSVKKNQ